MAEYINKQIAIEELENLRQKYEMQDDCDELVVRVCKNAIAELPLSDVAPVVHGKWDDSLDGITPYCSVCGCTHRCLIRLPLYCPNCGAKMDKDE